MPKKETIMRHNMPVAQVFIPTKHDDLERSLYEFSKNGGVPELLKVAKENNKMLRELLHKEGNNQ